MPKAPNPPRPRLRLLGSIALLAVVAAGLVAWFGYSSPKRAWRRAIHGDPARREAAWAGLRWDQVIPGLDHRSTIEEVFASMEDPDPEVRRSAVSCLPSINPDPLAAIARVAPRLADRDPATRLRAVEALGGVVKRAGPGHVEAVAGLARGLQDPSTAIRLAAVLAIGEVVYKGGRADDPLRSGCPDDPALKLVDRRLGDDDLAVRVESAYVLACNDRGDEAVAMLSKLVREQPPSKPLVYLAERALMALMVLAPRSDEAAATLVAELGVDREGYPDRPRDALAWAARQSAPARVRVRRLATEALKAEGPTLRHNAALLMHLIGAGGSAVPALVEALGSPSVETRLGAIDALADLCELPEVDPAIVPALEAATKDADKEVRRRAADVLATMDREEVF